jgi:hypothetical protein
MVADLTARKNCHVIVAISAASREKCFGLVSGKRFSDAVWRRLGGGSRQNAKNAKILFRFAFAPR